MSVVLMNTAATFYKAQTALADFMTLLAQPVTAFAREIEAHAQRLRPGSSTDPASLNSLRSEFSIASPHTSLHELLRGLEASAGFVAVQQGASFAVVASVNSLPVGHQLDLVGAPIAGHLETIGIGADIEPPGQLKEPASQPEAYPNSGFERMVEQALKRLSDYSALGQSNLARQLRLEPAPQIGQAKVIRGLLVDAIDALRPSGGVAPHGVPPREWHAYVILHDAYVEDVPNREIMSKLCISEGTFNRQRRKALRAVSIAIWEAWQSDATTV